MFADKNNQSAARHLNNAKIWAQLIWWQMGMFDCAWDSVLAERSTSDSCRLACRKGGESERFWREFQIKLKPRQNVFLKLLRTYYFLRVGIAAISEQNFLISMYTYHKFIFLPDPLFFLFTFEFLWLSSLSNKYNFYFRHKITSFISSKFFPIWKFLKLGAIALVLYYYYLW